MFRGIITTVIFMLVSVESTCRTISWEVLDKKTNELNSMLVEAINLSCEHIIEEYDDEAFSVKHNTIFYSTEDCPSQIRDNYSDSIKFNVTWVNLDNYKALPKWFKKYLENGVEVNFIKITLDGDYIDIVISQEGLVYDKKNRVYAVSFQGYDEYRYRYFCDTGKWTLYEISRNGIIKRPNDK